MIRIFMCAVLFCALVPAASGVPILDGLRDAAYGSALAVQTVQTQFGDGNPAGGSELDAAYGYIEGGMLYLILTGNLESNFNKLNIFLDSKPGGQNILSNSAQFGGNNPENDNWAAKYAGFAFDRPFEADYLITVSNGFFPGASFDIDFAIIGGGLGAYQSATDVFAGSFVGANANALPNGIGVAHNNTNTGGVIGGTGAANQAAALAVATGIELGIPTSIIGSPSALLVSAMINGSNHDYLSNQFLGGLPAGTGNLGGDGNGGFNGTVGQINLNNWAGDQYLRVVPEPGSILALGGGLLSALLLYRRRS